MTESITHVATPSPDEFIEKVGKGVGELQRRGYTVEVQYHPVATPLSGIVYSALIVGKRRLKEKGGAHEE